MPKRQSKTASAHKRRLHGVVGMLREMASNQSDEVVRLIQGQKPKPLPDRTKAENIAFEQGIYEGIRRVESRMHPNASS
jgi:hypothetical protein